MVISERSERMERSNRQGLLSPPNQQTAALGRGGLSIAGECIIQFRRHFLYTMMSSLVPGRAQAGT